MGKDRRKKDASKKQAAPTSLNETDSEPKGQREPRVRTQQRDIPKNTAAIVKDKTSDNTTTTEEKTKKTEPVNTEELFANLKRETDDIKALTTKKFARRQIFSNWEKYEEPPPQPQYEVEIQGADYESLLQMPISGGGHFQFKSERSWDANVSALSGELFSLDVDLLADGLATIPLYKKLNLPITLFSKDEMENMNCLAMTALKQYNTAKKDYKKTRERKEDVKQITNRLLDIIKESSPAPTDENQSEDKTILNFNIDQPEIQNEIHENVNENESYNYSLTNDKPESNEKGNLRLTPPPSCTINKILSEEQPNTVLKSLNKVPAEPFKEVRQDILPSSKIKKETLIAKENKNDNLLPKEIKEEIIKPVTLVRGTRKEGTPAKEIKRDQVTPMRDIKKECSYAEEIMTNISQQVSIVDSSENIVQEPVEKITTDIPKQVQQVSTVDSSENVVQEPAIPLGQRISKRKSKGQSQVPESQSKNQFSASENKTHVPETESKAKISEGQNKAHVLDNQKRPQVVESQKKFQPPENQTKNQVSENKNKTEDLQSEQKVQISENQVKVQQRKSQSKQSKQQHADDDLDFLLSLKKPVRETQLSGLQSSQVAKPSIEEDDTNRTNADLMLVSPQKQTEDLEDWLDAMLDD